MGAALNNKFQVDNDMSLLKTYLAFEFDEINQEMEKNEDLRKQWEEITLDPWSSMMFEASNSLSCIEGCEEEI